MKKSVAAALATTLAATTAPAAISYSNSTTLSVNTNNSNLTFVNWDVDGDTAPEFRLFARSNVTLSMPMPGMAIVNPNRRLGIASTQSGSNGRGFLLRPSDPSRAIRGFPSGAGLFAGPLPISGFTFGMDQAAHRLVAGAALGTDAVNFTDNLPAYIGFKFRIGASDHYGWAKINLNVAQDPSVLTISEWAYETTADTAISLGAVPEPTAPTLALLALGAAAAARRPRRPRPQEATAPQP